MTPRDGMGVGIESVKEWAVDFEELWETVGGCFFRHDLRGRAKGYVRGLLGRVERKNGWQMAEYLGDATPHPVQRLLDRAVWNADDVRDEIIRYGRSHLLNSRFHMHFTPIESSERPIETNRMNSSATACFSLTTIRACAE